MRLAFKPVTAATPNVSRMRFIADHMPTSTTRGVRTSPGKVGGVPGEWGVANDTTGNRPTMLHFPGGGYVFGSARANRPISGSFARAFDVFTLDYSHAPEHPYPRAVNEGVAAYKGLLDGGANPDRIVFTGDSAGGGLALVTAIEAKARGLPMPHRISLFSPWTDLAGTGPSMTQNAKLDPLLSNRQISKIAQLYAGDAGLTHWGVSPFYATPEQLAGLPPVQFHVGRAEIFRDDTVRMADKLRSAGVPVEVLQYDNVFHDWPLAAPHFAAANQALDAASTFLRRNMISGAADMSAGDFGAMVSTPDGVRQIANDLHDRRMETLKPQPAAQAKIAAANETQTWNEAQRLIGLYLDERLGQRVFVSRTDAEAAALPLVRAYQHALIGDGARKTYRAVLSKALARYGSFEGLQGNLHDFAANTRDGVMWNRQHQLIDNHVAAELERVRERGDDPDLSDAKFAEKQRVSLLSRLGLFDEIRSRWPGLSRPELQRKLRADARYQAVRHGETSWLNSRPIW